jgi:hypothetical protein
MLPGGLASARLRQFFADRQALEDKETTPMSNKLAVILAYSLLGSLVAFNVQAFPVSTLPEQAATPTVTLVRDFCGLNFHRGPDGYCVRTDAFYIYPPALASTLVRTAAALRRWRAPTATTSAHTANAFHIGGRNGVRLRLAFARRMKFR